MVTPVATVPALLLTDSRRSRQSHLQLLRSHDLLDVARIGVEHEYQCLVIEVGHLALERGDVGNAIAVGKVVAGDDRSGRLVVK